MNTIVQVQGLTKRYGPLIAVDAIDLHVEAGEAMGILGPNGAGKTTTLEMIEGLRAPDSGSITVCSFDVSTRPRDVKERIGVQLQTTALYGRIRVREAIALFGSYYRRSLPVGDLLSEVSLVEASHRFVEQLSGGQRQRLALALALVNDPDVLFLDEPTTGLDPQARRNVWGIIEQSIVRGKTIVMTTHSMEEAETLCRRVAIMDHGRIIALDSPDALIAAAGLESSVEIADVPDGFRAAIDELALAVRIDEIHGRLVLRTSEPSRALMELTRLADRMNLELREVSVRRATLEDLFLTLTGRQLRE